MIGSAGSNPAQPNKSISTLTTSANFQAAASQAALAAHPTYAMVSPLHRARSESYLKPAELSFEQAGSANRSLCRFDTLLGPLEMHTNTIDDSTRWYHGRGLACIYSHADRYFSTHPRRKNEGFNRCPAHLTSGYIKSIRTDSSNSVAPVVDGALMCNSLNITSSHLSSRVAIDTESFSESAVFP